MLLINMSAQHFALSLFNVRGKTMVLLLALARHLLFNREQIFKILLSSFFSHSYWCYLSLQLSAAKLLLFFDICKEMDKKSIWETRFLS